MRLGSLLFWPVWQEERSVPPEQLQVEKRKQNKCKIDAHQSNVTVITSRLSSAFLAHWSKLTQPPH